MNSEFETFWSTVDSPPWGVVVKDFPPCGVGVVCGIVVMYRFPPPCGVGMVYSL